MNHKSQPANKLRAKVLPILALPILTLPLLASPLFATGAHADTMTLKIPLKVVLMRDEVRTVHVQCSVDAYPYSSPTSAIHAANNGTAIQGVRVTSQTFALDSFGNLDVVAEIPVNLDEITNLPKHYLQSGPRYRCDPEFFDAAGNPVLDDYNPRSPVARAKLYDAEASTFEVSDANFVPDAPSRIESMLGGRSSSGTSGELKAPTRRLGLRR